MNQQQSITVLLICAFVFSMAVLAESAVQFVSMVIFLFVPVAIAFAVYRIGIFSFRYFKFEMATRRKQKDDESRNIRVTNQSKSVAKALPANALKGEQLMMIPAYARKEQNRYFPMTTSTLNGFVVMDS